MSNDVPKLTKKEMRAMARWMRRIVRSNLAESDADIAILNKTATWLDWMAAQEAGR
jgi:hypothetical protein